MSEPLLIDSDNALAHPAIRFGNVIAEAWVSPRESRTVAPVRNPLPSGRPRPAESPRPRARATEFRS